jgi:hypothetical protein
VMKDLLHKGYAVRRVAMVSMRLVKEVTRMNAITCCYETPWRRALNWGALAPKTVAVAR